MPITETKWFQEIHKDQQSFALAIEKVHYHQKSKYQDILIFENKHFGRVMVLDDAYMLSDIDEHMYHKAITTYGMQNIAADKNNLNILVIGAGDGGTVRDLLRNWDERIAKVSMVEIDQDVINVSRDFFPALACELDNPKLELKVQDALQFIDDAKDASYDLILCDSTDPEGFAAGLIEEDFYRKIQRVLKEDGIFCAQSGSPFFQKDELEKTQTNMSKVFADKHTYFAPVIVYPGTIWSFTVAGTKIINKANIDLGEFITNN